MHRVVLRHRQAGYDKFIQGFLSVISTRHKDGASEFQNGCSHRSSRRNIQWHMKTVHVTESCNAAESFTCHVSTCRKEYYRNLRASVRIVTRNNHTQAYGQDCNSFQEQGSRQEYKHVGIVELSLGIVMEVRTYVRSCSMFSMCLFS